jgi:antimicrobial peptide system SdpB family protein
MSAIKLTGADPGATAGRWARARVANPPWGSGLGLARTVLALGTLGTLLATPPRVLLSPLAGGVTPPLCQGIARASTWCLLPGDPQFARWLSVGVMLVVAAGWRPRFTAIPHWWVCWSLFASVTIQDGGDQITADLALLLIPVLLADSRAWHWQRPDPARSGPLSRIVAVIAILLMQIQVAGLYLDAGISKFGVPEWVNGTALFYIFRSVIVGPPSWLSPVLSAVTNLPLGVAAITWGAVALEIAIGLALLLPKQVRPYLLASGLLFHDIIAVSMGLISFDCAMSAALLVYLLPIGHQIAMPRWLVRRAERARAGARCPAGAASSPVPISVPVPVPAQGSQWSAARSRPGP